MFFFRPRVPGLSSGRFSHGRAVSGAEPPRRGAPLAVRQGLGARGSGGLQPDVAARPLDRTRQLIIVQNEDVV